MRKLVTTALLTALLTLAVSACSVEAPVPFMPTPTATAVATTPSASRILLSTKQEAWLAGDHPRYRFDLEWKEPTGDESVTIIEVKDGVPTVLSGDLPANAPATIDELYSWLVERVDTRASRTTINYSDASFPQWGLVWPAGRESHQGYEFRIENMLVDEFIELQPLLDEARAKWESRGLSDYVMDVEIWHAHNFLGHPGAVRLLVSGGRIEESFYVRGLDRDVYEGDETVEDLFDIVQNAIDMAAHSVVVEFNERLGYPVEISIVDHESTNHVLRYIVLSVSDDPDALERPPSVHLELPNADGSLTTLIATPEEIAHWVSVTDPAEMHPETPVCAVAPPPPPAPVPGGSDYSMAAFTGACQLNDGDQVALTINGPASAPPGAVARIDIDGMGYWTSGSAPLEDEFDPQFPLRQSLELRVADWATRTVELAATFRGYSMNLIRVSWELQDGVTGETIPGSEGSQLFYVEILGS